MFNIFNRKVEMTYRDELEVVQRRIINCIRDMSEDARINTLLFRPTKYKRVIEIQFDAIEFINKDNDSIKDRISKRLEICHDEEKEYISHCYVTIEDEEYYKPIVSVRFFFKDKINQIDVDQLPKLEIMFFFDDYFHPGIKPIEIMDSFENQRAHTITMSRHLVRRMFEKSDLIGYHGMKLADALEEFFGIKELIIVDDHEYPENLVIFSNDMEDKKFQASFEFS